MVGDVITHGCFISDAITLELVVVPIGIRVVAVMGTEADTCRGR